MQNVKKISVNTIPKVHKTAYIVGSSIVENLISRKEAALMSHSSFLVLIDETVEKLYGKTLFQSLKLAKKRMTVVSISPSETIKSVDSLPFLLKPFFTAGFDRNALFLAIGGGVVTDIGGFLGSVLLRGIDTILIPTTLLSQVDAAIGGKTGVNVRISETSLLKNMVGTFYPPTAVITDCNFLRTLPRKEILNGLGEMVKYWAGWGRPSMNILAKISKGVQMSDSELCSIISLCQQIKLGVIRKDPYETKGIRDSLNLGHTIGHAIEGACKTLSHGQAVAIGLVAVAKISSYRGILSVSDRDKIVTSIESLGLPIRVKNISVDEVMRLMKMDKKGGTFVLFSAIGKIKTRQRVPIDIIQRTLMEVIV